MLVDFFSLLQDLRASPRLTGVDRLSYDMLASNPK